MATTLFHISDVHFGVENRAALAEVVRAVADERPDALVCTGDLTQRATHAQYAMAARWFAQFEVPVWLEPGNHDMPYYNPVERFSDPFRRYRKLRDAVAVTSFETRDVVLLSLLTTVPAQRRWPWSDGVIRQHALDQTMAALGLYADDERLRIVAAHHPLHGPLVDGPSSTIGGNDALHSLIEGGMDAILTGHIHTPFDQHRENLGCGTQVIGAGTLSTRLRHGAPPSYNVLTCDAGTRKITVETRVLPAAH